jgi:hypothetical protein
MVRFQKLIKKFISRLTWHNIYFQQRELLKFLMCHQQVTFHAYCGATGPVSKMVLQQEKAFCVLCFEVSRSVITVQGEFHAWFKKNAPHKNNAFFKPCMKLMLHCNYRSGHHLGNWPRGSTVSLRSELPVAQRQDKDSSHC